MNGAVNGSEEREEKLVELYMDLTGASESMARGVFMHVSCNADEQVAERNDGGRHELAPDSFREELPGAGRQLQFATARLAPA